MSEYKMPDPGEGLTEAEIITWHVKVGDTVKVNDVIVEIETAKSLVELPSPYAGDVEALLVGEGETVDVGTPIIRINDGTEAPEAPAPDGPSEVGEIDLSNPAATGGGENQTLVGSGPRERSAKRRPRRGGASPATDAGAAALLQTQGTFEGGRPSYADVVESDEPAVPAVSAVSDEAPSRPLAKPPVRKLAKDLGVDLAQVAGSGADGVVTRADVEAAASGAAPAVATPTARAAGERETRIPIKGVRKVTAEAMVGSAFTAPHVTEWITVDVTRTMEMVQRLKGRRDFRDVKVSPLLIAARAVCLAARRTPEVNATWDDAAQEIVHKHYVNLGIAAATPRGLMVPNIPDADALNARELAEAIGALTAKARDGKTQPSEMSGGTFTITNVGVFGVDAGTPIINPGESAILAMGAIRKQPWVVDDEIVPRWITTLALSFDHRIVDGEQGSTFLADVASIMEDPGNSLLM